jgi:CRISPR-associated protein Cas1
VAHLVGPGKLKVVNGQLAYVEREAAPLRLDPAALRTLLCYGNVGITDEAFQLLFRHGVEVAWLSPVGTRCRGRLVGSDPSTTSLRLLQHRAGADPAWRLERARSLVTAKVTSQLAAARHYQRHGYSAAGDVVRQLQGAQAAVPAADLVQVRGVEGAASAAWFALLGKLLLPPWTFGQRVRRPPTDPVNALLSLGYTWLLTRTVARCEAAGLEVYLGALHEYRPGRPSLGCDLMEPLRVPAVDRWVIQACNTQAVTPADFLTGENGTCLQRTSFGRILHTWEEAWQVGGQDASLDALVEEVVGSLRQAAARWSDAAPGASPDDVL